MDERSIVDVLPSDLDGFTQCHFFAGIGGWSQALMLAGWPTTKRVWTGSCPCQPFSAAGKGAGVADERHLWPAFKWLIEQCQPPTVFGEQVASKLGREWLAGVFADLEAVGYNRAGADLCAAGVGAPHIRQRLYWMADAFGIRRDEQRGAASLAIKEGLQTRSERSRELSRGVEGLGAGVSGMGDTGNSGLQGGEWSREAGAQRASGGHTSECGGTIGVADAMRKGREGEPFGLLGASHKGSWSNFGVVQCLDGKARRFEPGSFPLADGIPNRVVKLRGFGNAIVPEIASEFIKACQDVI